jgi:hypothetical protein
MASLTLAFDTRKATKQGKYPLLFRIGLNRKYAHMNTGIHLYEHEFKPAKSMIIGDASLNASVKQLEVNYLKKLQLILAENPEITDPVEIKKLLTQKPVDEVTIEEFWKEHIETLYVSSRNGGANVYKMALSALSKHMDFNIPFRRFSYKDLMQLEQK